MILRTILLAIRSDVLKESCPTCIECYEKDSIAISTKPVFYSQSRDKLPGDPSHSTVYISRLDLYSEKDFQVAQSFLQNGLRSTAKHIQW